VASRHAIDLVTREFRDVYVRQYPSAMLPPADMVASVMADLMDRMIIACMVPQRFVVEFDPPREGTVRIDHDMSTIELMALIAWIGEDGMRHSGTTVPVRTAGPNTAYVTAPQGKITKVVLIG
jgi:hypothetical protein